MYQRIILLILFPLFGFSQAPQKINFQSILRNSSGEVVANQSVSLKISILSGSIGGSAAYSETHTKTTDPSGLISLQIGNGTVLSGVFANISWGDFPHFIMLEADFSGGSNFVLLGTQELMSVPYALYASKTDTSSLNLVNRFNSKVNISDTSNMLLNYRTGLNNKVNISDTSSMLNPYLRKSDSIIADLQNQDKLLQSFSNVTDIDGNNYKTVKIGTQIWMSENLKTSRYRNGDVIPVVTDNTAWSGLTTGARSWYNNDSTLYEYPYGNLYNWYAASDNRNICPSGWHVPSDSEWTVLTDYLGGSVAGGKMKSAGTAYWNSPNTGATNESGFSALPGGYRSNNDGGGSFSQIGKDFWMVLKGELNVLHFRNLHYVSNSISGPNAFGYWNHFNETSGVSIRCLKDPDIDINQSLNLKVNIADTSNMLNPYLRKADAIIADLQKQVELLSSYTSLLASGLVDIDGNNYPVVKIGNQIWMKENLRVSRYSNGDPIPIVTDNTAWSGLTTGARSWYNNDSTSFEIPYGNLYNWYAVADNRNICPAGWHVPSDSEWTVLTDYLGGESVAGGKMKVTGTTYWNSPNAGATNESGFSALPGLGVDFGNDLKFEDLAFFYSSTMATSTQEDFVWIRFLFSFNDDIDRNFTGINVMASIRCLRD